MIDRDKVLVPPQWDSWGKIRVLREGFDVEGIHSGWSVDISPSSGNQSDVEGGAVELYEGVIKDSKRGDSEGLALLNKSGGRGGVEVPAVDTQEFLAGQLEILEAKAAEEKAARGGKEDKHNAVSGERVMEHVGPVQFNVGGIQVDAENMLERLKVSVRQILFLFHVFGITRKVLGVYRVDISKNRNENRVELPNGNQCRQTWQ